MVFGWFIEIWWIITTPSHLLEDRNKNHGPASCSVMSMLENKGAEMCIYIQPHTTAT